jgi:L-lysine exporter family protein LysE/ArgO
VGYQAIVPFGEGFLLGIGLIVGIGPQNAFILQQGLRRRFVFTVALLASMIDAALIALGTAGVGQVFVSAPLLLRVTVAAGSLFLLVYGWRAFASALRPSPLAALAPTQRGTLRRRGVVLAVLAVSLLNPSTYLDTLLIIGGSAARYGDALLFVFAAGAALASICWFFALAFGAARLGRALQSPVAARALDAFSGAVMWFVAARLLLELGG